MARQVGLNKLLSILQPLVEAELQDRLDQPDLRVQLVLLDRQALLDHLEQLAQLDRQVLLVRKAQ
jgi:hypothetical protein